MNGTGMAYISLMLRGWAERLEDGAPGWGRWRWKASGWLYSLRDRMAKQS